jgi:hypothetical protein
MWMPLRSVLLPIVRGKKERGGIALPFASLTRCVLLLRRRAVSRDAQAGRDDDLDEMVKAVHNNAARGMIFTYGIEELHRLAKQARDERDDLERRLQEKVQDVLDRRAEAAVAAAEALRVRAERAEAELIAVKDRVRHVIGAWDDIGQPVSEWSDGIDAAVAMLKAIIADAPAPPALGLTAEEAYARDAEAVGRAQHAEWKSWIVSQGYADHAFDVWAHTWGSPDTRTCSVCGQQPERHHPDMSDWDSLPEEKKGKYMAHAAYLLGFETRARLAAAGEA